MLLLSLPLPTMAFPTCSKYFPPLYAVFLHFPMFLLSSCIFPCFYSHFLSVPSYFLHVHSIFYDFYDIILQYSATNIAVLAVFLHFSLHFPMLFLSFPLPTITFSAFSRYFLAIPSHFPAFSRYFLAIFLHSPRLLPLFDALFLHFPIFFLSFPLHSIIFPAFSQYFLRFL